MRRILCDVVMGLNALLWPVAAVMVVRFWQDWLSSPRIVVESGPYDWTATPPYAVFNWRDNHSIYVSNTGTGTACTESMPCSFRTAVTAPLEMTGNTIIAAPGEYVTMDCAKERELCAQ